MQTNLATVDYAAFVKSLPPLPHQTFYKPVDDDEGFQQATTFKQRQQHKVASAITPPPAILGYSQEFPKLPSTSLPLPVPSSRKRKTKAVTAEIKDATAESASPLVVKRGEIIFAPKDGVNAAIYPHMVIHEDGPLIVALPLRGSEKGGAHGMVNLDTRTDPVACSPIEFDSLTLPRALSSRIKHATNFATDVEQVQQWAQICVANEDTDMADVAPHERTRERKRKVITHDDEGEKDYEEEDEEDKEDQEYGQTKRRVRQKVTKSKSSIHSSRTSTPRRNLRSTRTATSSEAKVPVRRTSKQQQRAQSQDRDQVQAAGEGEEVTVEDLMKEGGDLIEGKKSEEVINIDGPDGAIRLRSLLIDAIASDYARNGISGEDSMTLAADFIQRLGSTGSSLSEKEQLEISNKLNGDIKKNQDSMRKLALPDQRKRWAEEAPQAFDENGSPISNPLPVNWFAVDNLVFGHYNLPDGGKKSATCKDLRSTGRLNDTSFLYDYDPFRYHVKHTGTTPALTFFDSSVEKLMDENLGAVASFSCSLGRPVDEIGRPVMDALLRQPQLVLRQLHLPVKVKSHKSRKDDPRQLYLKIWLMRTTKQRDGEGTLLYQFHHPCNFSGGWGRRDQSLYQDTMVHAANLLSATPKLNLHRHFYESRYGGAPSTAGARNAIELYPLAGKEIKSGERFSRERILQLSPRADRIIENKLRFQSERMNELLVYNPYVSVELQGSWLQAAKACMVEYGVYRRWTYFPDLEKRALTGELSREEQEELNARNARLDEQHDYERTHPEYVEARKEYQRKYYQENREERLAYQAKWREANPNYQAEYYQKNREERLAYQAEYNQEHREERQAYQAEYNSRQTTKDRKSSRDRANLEREKEENKWRRAEVERIRNESAILSTSDSSSDGGLGMVEEPQVRPEDPPSYHDTSMAHFAQPQSSAPTPHIAPLARSLNIPRFFFPSDPPMVRVALRARRLSLSSFSNTFLSTASEPLLDLVAVPESLLPSIPSLPSTSSSTLESDQVGNEETVVKYVIDEEQEDEDLGGMEDHVFEERPESAEESVSGSTSRVI